MHKQNLIDMKIFYTLLLTLIVLSVHAQTIRRVNNNVGITGVNIYTTAQAAHDAASANDILIIEPSSTNYGDLTLTKPLKIYGNGYFLNVNTELKADQRSSLLGNVYFNTGSSGSLLTGIESTSSINIRGVSNVTITRIKGTNITIHNTNVANASPSNVSNIIISNNYLTSSISEHGTTGYTISNVSVFNNILNYVAAGDDPIVQSWIVRNNTIRSQSATASGRALVNSVFENNLLLNGTPIFFNVTTSYNVSATSSFSGGVGNQNNVSVTTEFIDAGSGISDDEKFQIKAGSPLKTAGSSGTEVGAYGGATPYVVSGIPAIPSIVNMVNTGTGSNSVPLQVTISVKSNN